MTQENTSLDPQDWTRPDSSHPFGPELFREAKALKIWMALMEGAPCAGLERAGC